VTRKWWSILVDAGADVNKFSPSDRWTAMHLAVEWCNHGLLGKLIAAGGDVNALGNGEMTPCHMIQRVDGARGDDAVRSLAMLIAAGANVHAADFKWQHAIALRFECWFR
jgi:ankyrin repeat protein